MGKSGILEGRDHVRVPHEAIIGAVDQRNVLEILRRVGQALLRVR